jgi:hypothetical protein
MRTGVRRTDFDLRPFLEPGESILDANIGRAVANVYAFVLGISSKGFGKTLQDSMRGVETGQAGIELVTAIAEHLSQRVTGLKADLFRKALQEALLDAAGLGYDLRELDVGPGLERYLRKRSPAEFLVLFLSRYVFNSIWIRVQDALRAKSGSQSLRKSAAGVERFCLAIVKSVVEAWDAEGKLEQLPAKSRLGNMLMETIERQLLEKA